MLGLSLYFNYRKHFFCKYQAEYPEYLKIKNKVDHVLYLKRKTLNFETKLSKYFGVNINTCTDIPSNILITRYEEI